MLTTHALIYDGRCGFCRQEAARLERWSGGRIRPASFHDPGVLEQHPSLTREQCEQAIQMISPDGRIFSGAEAVARIALQHPWLRLAAWLYFVPGLRQAADGAYRLIARNRYRLPGGACADSDCAHSVKHSRD